MDEITKGKIQSIRTSNHTLHSDPSHAWLCVKESHLDILNIKDKISSSSYINNGFVYLEEDVDIPVYINALFPEGVNNEAFDNFKLEFVKSRDSNDESFIRNYRHYEI